MAKKQIYNNIKENYVRIVLHLLPSDFIKQLPTGYLENELTKRRLDDACTQIVENMLTIYHKEYKDA